jgi:hypothetical protein
VTRLTCPLNGADELDPCPFHGGSCCIDIVRPKCDHRTSGEKRMKFRLGEIEFQLRAIGQPKSRKLRFVSNGFIFTWNFLSRWRRWMAGSFIFCEARAFQELGGFSRELFVAEEIDFSKRLNRLAKSRGQQVIILHRNPLKTSARKVHLYSLKEHIFFLLRSFLGLGRTFKDRSPWYDGRR